MPVTCPKCHTTLRFVVAPKPGQSVTCPKCGEKIRFGAPSSAVEKNVSDQEPDEHEPSRKGTQKKRKKSSKPSQSFLSFFLKTSAAIVGLFMLLVVGYIAWSMWARSADSKAEFGRKISNHEQQVRSSLTQYENEVAKENADPQALDRLRGVIGFALIEMNKLNPPEDGKAYHEAFVQLIRRYHQYYGQELILFLALPEAEQTEEKLKELHQKFTREARTLQAAYDTAKQQYYEKHPK